MKRKTILYSIAAVLLALAATLAQPTPADQKSFGAALTFTSAIPNKRVHVISAHDDRGQPFPHAGSFGPAADPQNAGKTMGTPGGYGLPEWVEFQWRERSYPGVEMHEGQSYEAWGALVDKETAKLAIKKQRVYLTKHIPPEVAAEIIAAQAAAKPGKLSTKMLFLYLVWTNGGIKVRWRISVDDPGPEPTDWQGEPLE